MCCHMNQTGARCPVQNRRNQIIRLQKLDPPVLSGLMAVRGAAGLRRGASPPAKRCLDEEEAGTTTTQKVEVAASRSNR
jgi:hypothetical protein